MARKSKYSSNENVVNKKVWSVALYIRLSQEDSDNGTEKQESNSVTSQKTLLNEFIEEHDDLIVYDTYIDDNSELLQMLPTNQHLIINDVARKFVELPGPNIR